MTSPSSYLFYDQFYPEKGIQEGTLLNQICITETEVEIHSQVMREPKVGNLVGVTLAKHIYSWHLNKAGIRYLKQSCQKPGDVFKDISFDIVTNLDSDIDLSLDFDPVTLECAVFVEAVILGWFGDDFSAKIIDKPKGSILFPPLASSSSMDGKLGKFISGLYFPALRDDSFLVNEERITREGFKILLRKWQDFNPDTVGSLRDNSSYDEFIRNICHPSVIRTFKDVEILKIYPRELFLLSMMNLGNSMSSLLAEYDMSLMNVFGSRSLRGAFDILDGKFIRFMLDHLSSDHKNNAIKLILNMTNCFIQSSEWEYGEGLNPWLDPLFDRVPVALSSQLAEELFSCLQKAYNDLLADPNSHILGGLHVGESTINTQLADRFNSWFHENVLESTISTSTTTLISLEKQFFNLFGIPLPTGTKGEALYFSKEGTNNFAEVSEIRGERISSSFSRKLDTDLFSNLYKLVSDNRPMDKGSGCDAVSLSPHETEYGSSSWMTTKIYSLDDINNILERGVSIIDEYLKELGRKVTSENRVAFLTWGSRTRGFKDYWKYYDWGVTNPEKIFALKVCNVLEKKTVQLYNALPDEMFDELLLLELSGIKDEEIEDLAEKLFRRENAQFLDIEDAAWPSGKENDLLEPTWQGYRQPTS